MEIILCRLMLRQVIIDIPLDRPAEGVTPSGQKYTYSPNDASIGDVDGDGEYEIILKVGSFQCT